MKNKLNKNELNKRRDLLVKELKNKNLLDSFYETKQDNDIVLKIVKDNVPVLFVLQENSISRVRIYFSKLDDELKRRSALEFANTLNNNTSIAKYAIDERDLIFGEIVFSDTFFEFNESKIVNSMIALKISHDDIINSLKKEIHQK